MTACVPFSHYLGELHDGGNIPGFYLCVCVGGWIKNEFRYTQMCPLYVTVHTCAYVPLPTCNY